MRQCEYSLSPLAYSAEVAFGYEGWKGEGRGEGALAQASPISFSHSSSVRVAMPRSAAFLALDPAPGPATT